MSRGRKTYGNGKAFVALPFELLNSQAFISMSFSSRAALPYFYAKVKLPLKDPKRHSTVFSFSYSEARKQGFSLRTFSRIIQEVIRHGFVDPRERGGLRGMKLSESKFTLSERWYDFGKPNFEEIEWQQFHNDLI